MYDATPKKLYQDEDIYSHAYPMMRICQASFWPNSKPAEYQYDSGQEDCQYLQVDVQAKRHSRIAKVEARDKDGRGYDEEEGDCSDDSVTEYELVVFWKCSEASAHAYQLVSVLMPFVVPGKKSNGTIVLHCRKVEPDQIW